ncbi:MAG: hypothetical protein KDE56_18880 [Anaerolineales bacterium]|nr:hypothetical protein [Anaerolineales bacterium]
MKALLRFLFLPALFLLLVGCGSTATPQPTAAPTIAAEPTTPSHNAYDPDPTLIANTGRPQFVSAYADW